MWNRRKAGGWRLLGALLMMGGAGVLAWGIFGSVEPARENISQRIAAHAVLLPASAPSSAISPAEKFAHIWSKDIRQSLDGVSPAADDSASSTETVSSGPGLNMKLMATAVDAQRSCAMFSSDSQSDPLVCKVGQVIDGMKIISIQPQKVTVEYQGKRLDLTVPERYDAVAVPSARPDSESTPVGASAAAGNSPAASQPAPVFEKPNSPTGTPSRQ